MEVDPFEARLEFLSLLGKLNASQYSIQKVGNFAMRNRNLHEDLYSCIIEELEQAPSINAKMNIFYVLDSICQQSHKAGFTGYIDLIQRNLPKIIECVTPSGPKGNVNVAGTKKVLEIWRTKKLFQDSVIDKVEIPLLSRNLGASATATTDATFSKDDILKRMDEDRERHKRIREEIWIRPTDEDVHAEFIQNWEETSDLEDNDYEDIEAENEKYIPSYPWNLEFDRFLPSPGILKSKSLSEASEDMSTDSSGASKRLTSPEGTVTVSSTSARSTTTTSAAEYHHNNGYYHPPGRDYSHSYSYPHSRSQHHHPPPPPPPSHHTYSLSNSSSSHSRSHSHSYYDSTIPIAPAADTNSSSHRVSPSSRRSSPSSSYYPYSRPQYHERTSSSGSTHAGTSL